MTLLAAEDIFCPYLIQYKGAPVWPCRRNSVLQDLKETLQLSGLEMKCVALKDTEPAVLRNESDEIVVALDPKNRKEAELYANLTRRSVYTIVSLSELSQIKNVAVIIATWSQLSVSALEAIYEYSAARTSVGLIVGFDQEDLYRRVLISSAFAHASSTMVDFPPLPSHAILDCAAPATLSTFFSQISSPETQSKDVLSLLRGPSSILGIIGHSDGVDACLSLHAILCPRVEGNPDDTSWRSANCDSTGYCHRLRRDRTEALISEELIAPQNIATRILLMLSCYVALAEDCSVNPRHGLMRALLRNPRVGAIVTPWEIANCYPEELLLLAQLLNQGMDIGKSLYLFRRTAQGSLNECNRYLLFGDPSIRVSSISQVARSITHLIETGDTYTGIGRIRRMDISAVTPTTINDDIPLPTSWIKAHMEKLMQQPKLDTNGRPSINESLLIQAYARIADLDSPLTRRGAYRELLKAILFHEKASFIHWYGGDALELPTLVNTVTHCISCAAKGRLYRLRSRYSTRWMAACTRCNTYYADTPEGSDLINKSFSVTLDGRIEHNLPPLPNEVIGMNFVSSLGNHTAWLLGEEFDLTAIPPGCSWLWLHCLSDKGICSFSRMIDNRDSAGKR